MPGDEITDFTKSQLTTDGSNVPKQSTYCKVVADGSNNYDVVIVGAGFAGICLVLELNARFPNIKILWLEQDQEILGKSSTSANQCCKVNIGMHYFGDPNTASLCLQYAKVCLDFFYKHKVLAVVNDPKFPSTSFRFPEGRSNRNPQSLDDNTPVCDTPRLPLHLTSLGGTDLPRLLDHQFITYFVRNDSVMGPEGAITVAKALNAEGKDYSALFGTTGPIVEHLTQNNGPWSLLYPYVQPSLWSKIFGVFLVREVVLDIPAMRQNIQAVISQLPNVTTQFQVTVKNIIPRNSQGLFKVETNKGCFGSLAVSICAWTGAPEICHKGRITSVPEGDQCFSSSLPDFFSGDSEYRSSDLSKTPSAAEKKLIVRQKVTIVVELNTVGMKPSEIPGTCIFCLGRFATITYIGDADNNPSRRRYILSFEELTNTFAYKFGEKPDEDSLCAKIRAAHASGNFDAPLGEAVVSLNKLGQRILTGVSQSIPCMAKAKIVSFQVGDVVHPVKPNEEVAGFGASYLSKPDSSVHRRTEDFGLQSLSNGLLLFLAPKASYAPMLASKAADILNDILSRKTTQPSCSSFDDSLRGTMKEPFEGNVDYPPLQP